MSEELTQEEKQESALDEPITPLEVKVIPEPEKEEPEDVEYDDIKITKEEIEEFENGESSSG